MNRFSPWFLSAFLGVGVLLPAVLVRAQAPAAEPASPANQQTDQKQKPDKNDKNNKQKKTSQRQLFKELDTPYKKWLNEDVAYIITDEERKAFIQLDTNEEREQFIETFWQRRNPDPDSVDNPTREEHYRRIAYANEHFAAGAPGWKTDRGRMYIMYGPPDSITTHSYGETWDRPPDQGGGQTQTYAYDDWTYHFIEGIGNNVEMEFVDPSGTGEYRYTSDQSEKDALVHIPGAGLSQAELMGRANKEDRLVNSNGTYNPVPMLGMNSSKNDEFNKLELDAKIFAPPQVKFKDLEAIVSSRIVRDQIQFSVRPDFMRIAGDTVLVPITVQIPNNQMSFKEKDGVHTATLNLFGRISTITGRTVQSFEDTMQRDFPDTLIQQSLRGAAIYQKAVPLRPGLYRLDIVIKDTNSNNVGVTTTRLAVPDIAEDKLAASSLILADSISPVAAKDIGVGQFVIGSTKVRPKVDQVFPSNQPMGVFLQFYNLKTDEKTHHNNASIDVQVFRGDQTVAHVTQTGADLKQNGEQVTVDQVVELSTLAPGKYRIEVKATDAIANQTVSRSTDFTVAPAENTKTAAQASLPAR
jgi:GWxTD domain-containing protein